ncbi:hypothetical protein ABZX30_12865 [Streptomyces sp. NPDC004542]|uniref:hypothetical protein n=1 Tax=Streptomyces sp. NPDC004542 TaxID=3154281 RepID=UPI0033BC40FF
MSDSPPGTRPSEPDFLDRLLARHTPAAAPRPGVVRVRPRLAGPFERIEAVRTTGPGPDGAEPLWPAAPAAVSLPEPGRPVAREAGHRTERERTVVRIEQPRTPHDPAPRPPTPTDRETPLLRPAAPVAPGPRPDPDTARRTTGRARADGGTSPDAVPVPVPSGTGTVGPVAVATPLLTGAGTTATAREAVRQAAARRPGRGAEQVVQVQIGRLEVTAGGPPGSGGDRPRPRGAVRPEAVLSLAEYLARGRE